MSSPWLRMRFSEAVEVNPRRTVKRGTITPFVDMATLSTEAPRVRPSRSKSAGAGGSRFRNGDTLFARITPCTENGKTGLVDGLATGEVGTGSTEFIVLGPRHRLTLARFVYYLAKNPAFRSFAISQMRGTSGRQRVPASVFDDYMVGVPSLPEQRKIAAILSSVDDAIEKNQAVIDQVQVVKRGLMQDLLTRGLPGRHRRSKHTEVGEIPWEWDVCELSTLCDRMFVGIAQAATHAYVERGVPIVRTTNVHENRLDVDNVLSITNEFARAMKRKALCPGDVLTARTGYPGTSVVVPDSLEGAQCFTLLVSRPGPRLRSRYLCHAMNSDQGRQIVSRGQAGGAQQNLNVTVFKRARLALPSIEEQDAICDVLDACYLLERREEGLQGALETIKTALMSVLLTGELRVTPDPEPA